MDLYDNFNKISVEIPTRTEFYKLEEELPLYQEAGIIGENTSNDLAMCMVNFLECLVDERYCLPAKKYKLFRLIKDMGVGFASYGNASGGLFEGFYRSFLIEYKNSTERVSVGVNSYCERIKTVINVAIDNEKVSHHALQLVVDDNCSYKKNTMHFYHHGKIAIGKIGSGKIAELREFVKKDYSDIICGQKYYLGALTHDHLWRLTDNEFIQLIENLISYSLVRDEHRNYKNSQK